MYKKIELLNKIRLCFRITTLIANSFVCFKAELS